VGTGFYACVVVFWSGYGIVFQICPGFYLVIVHPGAGPVAKAIVWVDNHRDHESVDP
jgi:hypothetical protein